MPYSSLMRLALAAAGDGALLSSNTPNSTVVPGAASLTMPGVNAQFAPPPAWRAAADARGYACLVFATRAWPGGEPGDAEAVAAFANDEQTLATSAQVVLPVRTLRAG